MNYIDLVLCIPLVWGFYKGFTRGIIIEAATLAAFGLGVWGGIKFSDLIAGFLKNYFHWNSPYLPIISFAVIFLGIIIGVYAVAKLAERFVKAAALGIVNKLTGAAFGVLKFALVISVLIFILESLKKNIQIIPEKTIEVSLLYKPIGSIAPAIIPGLKGSSLNELIDREKKEETKTNGK